MTTATLSVAGAKWIVPIFDNIPDELKSQPWAVWIAEPRAGITGKFNKAPRSPITGKKIGADKPELFGSFAEAKAAYTSGRYTGVGVLLTGNGIIGIDIDAYKEAFQKQPEIDIWARKAGVAGAYCELSPSGTGVRLFIRGILPGTGRKSGSLEIYDDKRFLTVTGSVLKLKDNRA